MARRITRESSTARMRGFSCFSSLKIVDPFFIITTEYNGYSGFSANRFCPLLPYSVMIYSMKKITYSGIFALLALMGSLYTASAETVEQRYRQASLPSTSAGEFARLAKDPEAIVRERVAANRKTPAKILLSLAHDPVQSVKIALATNLSAPEAIYKILVHDNNTAVRSVVARYEFVPLFALKILASDPDADIRLEVARNLNSDRKVLQQLMNDRDDQVKAVASLALERINNE